MDTNFGLSSLASIRIITDAIFRVINTMKSGTLHVKKRLLWSELTFVSFECIIVQRLGLCIVAYFC